MRLVIILLLTIGIQLGYGQDKPVPIDSLYSADGTLHKVIHYTMDKKGKYYDLALQCKTKADSLLKAHFDLDFYEKYILLDAESSICYDVSNSKWVSVFHMFNEKPNKVELVYNLLNKDSDYFNLIKITLECGEVDEIKIIHTDGIPETKNYKIAIDYEAAKTIAKRKGFVDNTHLEDYEPFSGDMEVLSLHFTHEKLYEWGIHKNVKTTSKGEDRICSTFITTSKELRINAQTGKTLKKRSKYTRSVRWY